MDKCRVRPSMAVIPQKPDQLEEDFATRTDQLGLSEKRNGVPFSRTREICPGYNSSTASPFIQVVVPRRSHSPTVNSKTNGQELKLLRRCQSAERRRPSNLSSFCSRPLTPTPKSSRPSGRNPDAVWPSMKRFSLCLRLNSSKNAVFERKCLLPDLSENAGPGEDFHERTVDQAGRLGLGSRKISANSSKSSFLISPSRVVLQGRIQDSHLSDKRNKQMRNEVERTSHLYSSEKTSPATKPSLKKSPPKSRSHHGLLLNNTLSDSCHALREFSSSFSASKSTKSGVCSTPSVLHYTVQVRKGKQTTKHIDDAHQLRMFYNRYLQWCFINSRAANVLSVQQIRAETMLYYMESVYSELCDPLLQKRIDMQHMKQDMKLNMLLKEKITNLEDWGTVENEHCISISGTFRALRASTLWIPVTGGARVDIKAMKNAISSAVDAMQAMGPSLCYLSSKVDQVLCLVSDLLATATKESLLLDKCAELLALAGELQVQDSSLRGHLMQLV